MSQLFNCIIQQVEKNTYLPLLFFAEITIFRLLSKFADGVREVLVAYDQKGKDLTINDVKQAYRKGRNMVNISVPEE